MANHRHVTEEDLHVTEALIADSVARLKRSVREAPHEAIRPAADVIREHPFAATAAAAGAGVLMFQVARMLAPATRRRKEPKAGGKGRGIGGEIMGQLMALAAPYLVSMLQQQLGKAISGSGEHR
ncbi:MAG TPA: hypothetical protein VLT35_05030 [Methanocella sp.]|nr:hypothetical protein [Methanocella sp.]